MIATIVFIVFGVLLALDMFVLYFTDEMQNEERKEETIRFGFLGLALSLILLVSGLLLLCGN